MLEAFTAETGISVATEFYPNNETLLANLQAGGSYDVVVPSDYMVKTLIDQGLLQEIEAASMPNFTRVGAPHDDPNYDPDRRYSAPYMWGTTGFTYDSAKVSGGELEESWQEVFEPRKGLEGKVAVLDDSVSLYNAAAHYLGFDQCTKDPKKARQIFDLLMSQKPKVTFTARRRNCRPYGEGPGCGAAAVERRRAPGSEAAENGDLCLSERRTRLLVRKPRGTGQRFQPGGREDFHQLGLGAGEHRPGQQLYRLYERGAGLGGLHGRHPAQRPGSHTPRTPIWTVCAQPRTARRSLLRCATKFGRG